MRKMDLDPYFILCTEINLLWIINPNIKVKMIKFLEINFKSLCNFE